MEATTEEKPRSREMQAQPLEIVNIRSLRQRAELLQWWADFLDSQRP